MFGTARRANPNSGERAGLFDDESLRVKIPDHNIHAIPGFNSRTLLENTIQ
jgi:hypothetical protein